MRKDILSPMSRWMVPLLGISSGAWVIRVLWIQYGQHSSTIRLFNRGILNPIALTFAGRPGIPYAVLHHFGRHSGQSYVTPLFVQPVPHGWLIPLTYGEITDWYRNIKTAGRCTIQWKGRRYSAEMPERIGASHAFSLFPLALRLVFRVSGIREFVKLTMT